MRLISHCFVLFVKQDVQSGYKMLPFCFDTCTKYGQIITDLLHLNDENIYLCGDHNWSKWRLLKNCSFRSLVTWNKQLWATEHMLFVVISVFRFTAGRWLLAGKSSDHTQKTDGLIRNRDLCSGAGRAWEWLCVVLFLHLTGKICDLHLCAMILYIFIWCYQECYLARILLNRVFKMLFPFYMLHVIMYNNAGDTKVLRTLSIYCVCRKTALCLRFNPVKIFQKPFWEHKAVSWRS